MNKNKHTILLKFVLLNIVMFICFSQIAFAQPNTNGGDPNGYDLAINGPNVVGSNAVCFGTNSTTLNLVGSNGTYQWQLSSDGTSFININGANTNAFVAVNLTNTTYYRVVVTNSGTSINSTTATITVNTLPTATISSSSSTTFCNGSNIVLTASEGANYLWSNGLTTRSISVTNAGVYTVTVTNSNSCSATSSSTTTVVNALPTITGNTSTYINLNSQLSGSGTASNTNAWVSSNTGIATVSTTGLVTGISAGSVSITYNNNNGCTISKSFTVQTTCSVAGTVSNSTNVLSRVNSTTLTLTGNNGTIQWQYSTDNVNFSSIAGMTSTTYIASNINSTTYYRAIVTNGACLPISSNVVQLITVAPMEWISNISNNVDQGISEIYQVSVIGGGTLTKTYSISNSNDGNLFNISSTGIVSLKSGTTNYLTKSNYSFTIIVNNTVQTITQNIIVLVNNITLSPPTLVSPINNAVKQISNITLSWGAVNTATSYTLQYGTDSILSTNITTEVISTTTKTLGNLAANTNYYWRVKSNNSNYSSINKFQTYVQVPILNSIKAGNKIDTLLWTLADTLKIKYFKIIRYSNGSTSMVIDSLTSDKRTYIDNKNLTNNVDYYYRVVAGNTDNIESEYSNTIIATPFNIRPKAVSLISQSFNNIVDTAKVTYTFSAAGSYDTDGSIIGYKWFINDSLVINSNTNNLFTYQYSHGTTNVKLQVIDNDNEIDSSNADVKVATVSVNLASGSGVLGGVTAVNPNLILTADTSSNGASGTSTIYKMDRFGNVVNTITVNGKITTTPSVSSDSTLFITSGNSISCFDKNGNAKWTPVQLDGSAKVTPTVDSASGKIFVGTSNNKFYSIDATTGKVGWSVSSDAPIYTSAMITGDRRLVFVTESGTFYGFDIYADTSSTKNAKWKLALGEIVTKSGAIDNKQNIYYGTASGNIIKIKMYSDGTTKKLWSTHLSDSILASPVLDAKGRLYVGTKDGKFYRINTFTGDIKWNFKSNGAIKSTPSISNYGTVIFATSLGNIYALDSNMKIKWLHKEGAAISANILYIKNMVYFATENGKYFGLYDDPKAVYNSNTTGSSINNTRIELNKIKSSSIASNNTPVISLIRQLDQSSEGLISEVPMWGTFQGNAQRTGVQVPDCPELPIINVPLCYDVIDSVKITTSDLVNKSWVINNVVQKSIKDTAIKIKPTDQFDLQTTSIYGCTVIGSALQYNMNSVLTTPIISNSYTNSLCDGDSTILSVSTSTNKIIWNSVNGSVKDFIGASLKVNKSDQYFVTEVNEYGCKATSDNKNIYFNSIPTTPILSRDVNGGLMSSVDIGNIWFKDGVQISDTTKTIKPSQMGSYRVKSSSNGCFSSMSSAYFYLVTDVINIDQNQFIKVLPNPFINQISIDFIINGYQKLNIELRSIESGQVVFKQNNVSAGSTLYVDAISPGMYLCRAFSSDLNVSYKFKLIKVR